MIVPHGVLFRGAAEGIIRNSFIDENILEAVIGLPQKLFFGTPIPAAILIFNKARKPWAMSRDRTRQKHILFIDGSNGFEAEPTKSSYAMWTLTAYSKPTLISSRSISTLAVASRLILKPRITTSIFPRYVDTFEEEEEVDIPAVQKEIEEIESELVIGAG